MDAKIRKNINELAEILIEHFEIEIPIQNTNSLVDSFGGKLDYCDFLEGFIDGDVQKKGNKSFQIRILNSLSEQRKKFTIAHELGHLFLHMGYMLNDDLWDASGEKTFARYGNSENELQAHEFAAALLMPKQHFEKAIYDFEDDGRVDMKKIATHFGVSVPAATNRAKWLGYIAW